MLQGTYKIGADGKIVMWEVHGMTRNYSHPDGPKWEPTVDALGRVKQYWTRREAEIVATYIASCRTARPTRIMEA